MSRDFSELVRGEDGEPAPTSRGGNDDTPFRLRSAGTVVTTARHKRNAFVLGLQAGEFDHFASGRPARLAPAQARSPSSTTVRNSPYRSARSARRLRTSEMCCMPKKAETRTRAAERGVMPARSSPALSIASTSPVR
jgi:hypothetical protein